MLFRKLACVIAAILIPATCSICLAQTVAETKTKSVAVFKNGLGFFVREGNVRLADGWGTTEVVPQAALGTYWIGSSKPGVTVERLIASEEDISRSVPAVNIPEVLAANVGKVVRLTVGDKVIEGKLLSVPEGKTPVPDRIVYNSFTPMVANTPVQLALIQTDGGTIAVNKHSVSWVEFIGEVNPNRVETEKVKRFRFKVAGAKDQAPVTMGYLQKGISWSPAYMIELQDEKKARITMQGLLANDVEDVDGATVYLVVGYPNFVFADTLSPLALGQSVSQFVERLSRPVAGGGYNGYGGVATQTLNVASYDYARSSPSVPEFGYSATVETPGAPEEDLFLYNMKDVTLKKGERAYYTVFSAEVPYEHVYEWEVPDTSGVQPSGYMDSSRRDQQPLENQVWHKLKFTNTSNYPWTTAPGLAMSNGNPLAQDTLKYTPKGAEGDLKLTIATDVLANKSELESSRENDALKLHGYTFARVTTEGELTIKSFKSQDITVIVKKTMVGEVASASDDAAVHKAGEGVKSVNPRSVITWEIPLKGGEEKVLKYTYSTYVRY